MTVLKKARFVSLFAAGLASVALSFGALTPAAALDKDNPDWPCVWRKVNELGAGTIWDGPALDKATGWQNDDAARKLSAFLIVRRIKLAEVEAAIKTYAEGQPADVRDQKLSELFAAVLSRTNDERKTVMAGIERFHKRQLARAKAIEKQGIVLPKDGEAGPDKTVPAGEIGKLSEADEKYAWEVRIFQERQQNIPIACEIPQLMDERAGAVARAIRALMKS